MKIAELTHEEMNLMNAITDKMKEEQLAFESLLKVQRNIADLFLTDALLKK